MRLKNKNGVWIFLLGLLCLSELSYAQAPNNFQPDIIPPSPEAANLGKYGEIPISYNTGTPNISIPLYEIVSHDIKMPIALTYHASGIKVDEIPGWVGQGFALQAGGVITRTMRGRPDENVDDGYFATAQWDLWQDMLTWPPGIPHPTNDPDAWQKHNFQYDVATGVRDLQPDIFSFNFGGYSGRIIFDNEKKPVVIPYQDLTIVTPFDNGSTGWTITTPEGIVYTFSNTLAELTTPLDDVTYDPFYSTWHLSSVHSLRSPGQLLFQYQTVNISGFETMPQSGVVLMMVLPVEGYQCELDPPYPTTTASLNYGIATKLLSRIDYPGGYVTFTTSGREDGFQSAQYSGKKLDAITVVNSPPNAAELMNVFTFNYGYFGSTGSKRLKLLSVTDLEQKQHSFEYNNTTLPGVHSLSRDHWGYFNNAPNTTLMPKLTKAEEAGWQNTYFGADRSATTSCVASMLQKITYPTGGYTQFTFEPHQAWGTIHSSTITETPQAVGTEANTSMNSYELGLLNYYDQQQISYFGGPIAVQSNTFTLTETKLVEFTRTITNSSSGEVGSFSDAYLYKLPILDYGSPRKHNTNGFITLEPGTYVLLASASQSGVSVRAKVEIPITYEGNYLVGGVRVASIQNFDGTRTLTRNFNYEINGESTGVLFHQPTYKTGTPCGKLYVASSDINMYGPPDGYHIGYKQVEVTEGDGSAGKTRYRYNNDTWEITRNMLEEELVLNASGQPVKQKLYELDTTFRLFSFAKMYTMKMTYVNKTSSWSYYDFLVTEKTPSTRLVYHKRIKERTYNTPSLTQYSEIITETDRAPLPESTHSFPTEVRKYINGKMYVERIINSPESSASLPATIITPVITYTAIVTGTSGLLYNATRLGFSQNLPATLEMTELQTPASFTYPTFPTEGTIPYKLRYTNTYATDKLIKQRSATDGVLTAFLWNGNNTRPIAKVTNAAQEDIAFTSFEGIAEGGWSFTPNLESTSPYTGQKNQVFVEDAEIVKSGLSSGKKYLLTCRAKNGTPTYNDKKTFNHNPADVIDGWHFYSVIVESATSVAVKAPPGTAIDELRLCPIDAMMTSLTYDKLGVNISSITDPNNVTTHYKYDITRLEQILDDNRDLLKLIQYNYKH